MNSHLDLEAINALNIALQRNEGTVLLVTYDHDLIDEVATRLWVFYDSGIEDFQGPYEEWKGKHSYSPSLQLPTALPTAAGKTRQSAQSPEHSP